MGFKGFLKKTLSVTGQVALVAGAVVGGAAYLAGKFIFNMIKDNGMSTLNKNVLTNLKKMDLTSEEREQVKYTERLQDKTDRARDRHNDLVKKAEKIEKIRTVYMELDELTAGLKSVEIDKEQRDLLAQKFERKQTDLNKIRVGELEGISSADKAEIELNEIAPKISELSSEYEMCNSELKDHMKEIHSIVRSKREEREERES